MAGTGRRLSFMSGKSTCSGPFGHENLICRCRSTTKDNDQDGEKAVDQPRKRDGGEEVGESFASLQIRDDTPGSLDNSTFEGNVGNWIQAGIADGTLDTQAANFGEVSAQGLPDWLDALTDQAWIDQS